MNNKTKDMTTIALLTAAICIAAPFTVPLPFTPVPIALANFVIYIAGCILGAKKGTISVIIYLLLGVIGIPVFAGFSSGLSSLAGPTGGYLIGYIFCAAMTGVFVEKFDNKIYMYPVGMIIGTIMCYIFGSVWLARQLNLGFSQALLMGVIPYIFGDALKITAASIAGFTLRNRLRSLNYSN